MTDHVPGATRRGVFRLGPPMTDADAARGRDDVARAAIPGFTLLLGAVPLICFWFAREFTHDDFYLAYLAWIRSTDLVPGVDYFVPNFTALAEFAALLFGTFEESLTALHVLRFPILIVALTLLWLTFEVARRLSGSRAWAAGSAAIVVWHPLIVARIADIRTDSMAAALLLGAVVLLLADEPRPFRVGLCAGLAAVLSPKMVVAVPFLGLAMLLAAKGARVRAGALFAGATGLVPIAYFAMRIAVDGWDTFWNVFASIRDTAAGPAVVSGLALLGDIAEKVPALAAMVILGAILLALPPWNSREEKNRVAYVVFVSAFTAVFLATNPALYVYNAVILVPLFAPLLSGIGSRLGPGRGSVIETAGLAIICLLAVNAGLRPMGITIVRNHADQKNTLAWMWENTTRDERVFDWQGMHFGRRGIHHWWIYGGILPAYRNGAYRLHAEWRQAPVTLVLPNYRFNWLAPEDRRFLRDNFVPLAPCAAVPGRVASRSDLIRGVRFDVFAPGTYETSPGGAVLLDGRPVASRMRLESGTHRLHVARPEDAPERFGIRFLGARRRLPPCGVEPLIVPIQSGRRS